VLLISFHLDGDNLRLYPLLAPHLGISGWNNTAWVDHGLLATRDDRSVCLMNSTPFARASAGYVGYSDGWQDFSRNGRMTQTFVRAEDGNIHLEGHPTTLLPFVDVATGSLGQGLSVGVGIALNAKQFEHSDRRVFVLMGDGESAEGSIWEAAQWAALRKLNNLCAIIDINRLGQSQPTMLQWELEVYKTR
jgi:Glucodextranase, domain N/Transketolase, thiamine diphosphate binding domain